MDGHVENFCWDMTDYVFDTCEPIEYDRFVKVKSATN